MAVQTFPNSVQPLYESETAKVLVSLEFFHEFLAEHINLKGRPVMTVKGTVRDLKWSSRPGGYMEVWTEPIER